MKILIACNVDSYDNPYVKTLYDEMKRQNIDVTCSINEFWGDVQNYDIIHIQWPNLLVSKLDNSNKLLSEKISEIHHLGKKIIVTLHNLLPHYSDDNRLLEAYRIIYENTDCFIHLGNESIKLLKNLYPNITAEHYVIPHHTFDTLYDMNVSVYEAREMLNIPQNMKCLVSFGRFRNDEERDLLLLICKSLPQNIYYLMPGFNLERILRKNVVKGFKAFIKRIKYAIIAKKYGIHMNYKFIPDNMVPYYIKAADAMLIPRMKILNSGSVSLGMLCGIPIVGPNVGNVGSELKKTGNYVFDIENLDALPGIVSAALNNKLLGKCNIEYANRVLKTSVVVREIVRVYMKYSKV